MANASTTIDPALSARVSQYLAERSGGTVDTLHIEPLAGGACQDNYVLNAVIDGVAHKMVLRSDAVRSLPGSLKRDAEFAVIQAAKSVHVRTPAVRWLADGLLHPGRFAYVMDWVEGEALGRRVVKSSEYSQARTHLPRELASELAKIHTVTPQSHPALRSLPMVCGPEEDPIESALRFLRQMLARLPEGQPALAYAAAWLEAHKPATCDVTLVHGDFRTGNFLVQRDGLGAVLDWEFAHWGDRTEDLAWLCLRDWRFGELDKPVGGLCDRPAFYQHYRDASGHEVDPTRVRWWEIMGNTRWAAGSILQGERYLSGEEQDLELLAIARRAPEMAWEALRWIGQS
ncbi:MAG: phosphotransferase family protein [Deltaproteobacteria bacterium]|nr:phosphotransferase family protein [Deltaproteobacteria bacterium]